MVRSNQFLQKLPNTSKYVKSVFFNPILVVVFLLLLGFSACSQDEDHAPDPIHVRVGSPLRDFLFFKEGSYWIYKSNDGLYDTVTVTRYKVDTLTFVDEKGRLISTQEYFWFTHYSSYLKDKYEIYRLTVAPNISTIIIINNPVMTGNFSYLVQPSETNTEYCFIDINECFKIENKIDTTINKSTHVLWSINYAKVPPYYNKSVRLDFVSGYGVVRRYTEFENRTWELIDYYIIQ